MVVHVVVGEGGHRVSGGGCADLDLVNAFLAHLSVRNFLPATRRAYAYDLLNFLRFLSSRHQLLGEVRPTDLFDYLEWQSLPRCSAGAVVVRLAERGGVAPATMNRRIAAVRGLFEYATLSGARTDNPVPAARRATGVRALQRGLLGHLGPGRPRGGGRLVGAPRRLPESLELADVAAFVADLITARDRAMALAMLLGGLRAGEVRGLRLADVDFGLRRIRVVGKGGKERVVPVEQTFFTELTSYLRNERPAGCRTRPPRIWSSRSNASSPAAVSSCRAAASSVAVRRCSPIRVTACALAVVAYRASASSRPGGTKLGSRSPTPSARISSGRCNAPSRPAAVTLVGPRRSRSSVDVRSPSARSSRRWSRSRCAASGAAATSPA